MLISTDSLCIIVFNEFRVIRNETLCLFLLLNIHSYINLYGGCFIIKIKLGLLVRTVGKEEIGLWFLFRLLNEQRI